MLVIEDLECMVLNVSPSLGGFTCKFATDFEVGIV